MKTEYKIFGIVALFLIVTMGVYWWWSDAYQGAVEYVGVVALGLSFLLTAMIGGYFWFVSRRIDLRPEDRDEGEMADGAGEVGFFSPGSYWPFGLALAALGTGVGLVYLQWWLIAAGIIAVLITTAGLLFEYYTGARGAH